MADLFSPCEFSLHSSRCDETMDPVWFTPERNCEVVSGTCSAERLRKHMAVAVAANLRSVQANRVTGMARN